MKLHVLRDVFSANGFRIREGAMVAPIEWRGDWLNCEYRLDDNASLFVQVHRMLFPVYFGIPAEALPDDLKASDPDSVPPAPEAPAPESA